MYKMEYQHGCYSAHWEDNLLHLRHVGDATVDDVVWLSNLVVSQAAKVGKVDIVANLSQLGNVPPAVRKQFSQEAFHKNIRSIGVFGASGTLRAVVTLAMRAGFLFSKAPVDISFFGTEAEARAWIQRTQTKKR